MCVLIQARKGSDEKQAPAVIPKKSCTDSAAGSTSSLSKTNRSVLEDVVSPSPQKNLSSLKASSKLAMMKKRDQEKDAGPKSKTPMISPTKIKTSPRKEPIASSSSDVKFTPKTGTTPTALKTSPKKPEVSFVDASSETSFPDHHGYNLSMTSLFVPDWLCSTDTGTTKHEKTSSTHSTR